jgi:hypothetical protein
MKVYLSVIIGYMPNKIVRCLSAFLDACYIARCQEIDNEALSTLKSTLWKFQENHKMFQTSGVRPTGFSLPRQHAFMYYCHQIEDFSVLGGLCSSITKSRHIMAIKKPWQRSNCYNAMGQMLLTNQQLNKLATMCSDFVTHSMLPAGHAPSRDISHILTPY